jgi:hypothetical protein
MLSFAAATAAATATATAAVLQIQRMGIKWLLLFVVVASS